MRDGTTVRIPYLTQFANYNQRIVITNRGGSMADYRVRLQYGGGRDCHDVAQMASWHVASQLQWTYISLQES